MECSFHILKYDAHSSFTNRMISLDTILILLFFLSFISVQSKIQYGDKLCFEFPTFFWRLKKSSNQKHYNNIKLLFIFGYNFTAMVSFFINPLLFIVIPDLQKLAVKILLLLIFSKLMPLSLLSTWLSYTGLAVISCICVVILF